jgi:HemY protein
MLRVLFFIVVVGLFGFAFAWLAETPGQVVMTVAGREIRFTLMVAAIVLVTAVVAVMLVWWLFKVVVTSPQRMQRFFRARRRDRGYQSLSTGIIAAGAGDSVTARKMLKQADGLLRATSEPLIQLLEAQATMVEGNNEEARAKFEAMLEDPELRMLGLRGLYMEAKRLGDRDAARHYAERAAELAPHLTWAGNAAIELKTAAGDWDGAIKVLESQKSARQVDKDVAKRKRAVLLTALAMENIEKDPAKAKSAAVEAHRLAPDFAPAAVTAAQAAFRLNDMRKGVSVLEQTWKKTPHPEVAIAYINARPGDSALDRYKRAQRLEKLKPNNTESSMILAQMALEAGEFEDARKAVASVLRNEPREGAYMLMADIEETQTGDQGKVREWMARAMRAPRDAAWTADGYVSENWAPVSPVTGRFDAFEWRVPVERLGAVLENDLDPMVPGSAQEPPPPPDAVIPPAPVIDHAPPPANAEPKVEIVEGAKPPPEIETAPVEEPKPKPEKNPAAAIPANADDADMKLDPTEAKPADMPVAADVDKPASEAEADTPSVTKPETEKPAEKAAEPIVTKEAPAPSAKPAPEKDNAQKADETVSGNPPIPDDPGVDADQPPEEPVRRFRLF